VNLATKAKNAYFARLFRTIRQQNDDSDGSLDNLGQHTRTTQGGFCILGNCVIILRTDCDLSMVNVSVGSSADTSENSTTYTGALAIVTSLFFMWGFVTVLNVFLCPTWKASSI